MQKTTPLGCLIERYSRFTFVEIYLGTEGLVSVI